MAEKATCPSCKNRRTIECPCCLGRGNILMPHFTPHLGKFYTCVDCTGSGKVPCPVCAPKKETKHPIRARQHEIKLRFREA
jgi:hypothetical protein